VMCSTGLLRLIFRSETTRRSTVSPSVSLNAFWAIENDFFDRAVPDGGEFHALASEVRINNLLAMSS